MTRLIVAILLALLAPIQSNAESSEGVGQYSIIDLPDTPSEYRMTGGCYPEGNAKKKQLNITYCGCSDGGEGYSTNAHGDKFRMTMIRRDESRDWTVILDWDAFPNTQIMVLLVSPSKKVMRVDFLTGRGKKTVGQNMRSNSQLFYVYWQAYPVK